MKAKNDKLSTFYTHKAASKTNTKTQTEIPTQTFYWWQRCLAGLTDCHRSTSAWWTCNHQQLHLYLPMKWYIDRQ